MAEKKKWLRNIKDGEIYGWNEILAENPLTEEVTEEEAFPEKHMPKKQRGRPPKVNLETENIFHNLKFVFKQTTTYDEVSL